MNYTKMIPHIGNDHLNYNLAVPLATLVNFRLSPAPFAVIAAFQNIYKRMNWYVLINYFP
ncbi:MAG: hypothetical protein AABX01_06035 [Candidatus Micrarchaeota archaeon]